MSSNNNVIKVIRFAPWPLSKRWFKVYFANENVHFFNYIMNMNYGCQKIVFSLPEV